MLRAVNAGDVERRLEWLVAESTRKSRRRARESCDFTYTNNLVFCMNAERTTMDGVRNEVEMSRQNGRQPCCIMLETRTCGKIRFAPLKSSSTAAAGPTGAKDADQSKQQISQEELQLKLRARIDAYEKSMSQSCSDDTSHPVDDYQSSTASEACQKDGIAYASITKLSAKLRTYRQKVTPADTERLISLLRRLQLPAPLPQALLPPAKTLLTLLMRQTTDHEELSSALFTAKRKLRAACGNLSTGGVMAQSAEQTVKITDTNIDAIRRPSLPKANAFSNKPPPLDSIPEEPTLNADLNGMAKSGASGTSSVAGSVKHDKQCNISTTEAFKVQAGKGNEIQRKFDGGEKCAATPYLQTSIEAKMRRRSTKRTKILTLLRAQQCLTISQLHRRLQANGGSPGPPLRSQSRQKRMRLPTERQREKASASAMNMVPENAKEDWHTLQNLFDNNMHFRKKREFVNMADSHARTSALCSEGFFSPPALTEERLSEVTNAEYEYEQNSFSGEASNAEEEEEGSDEPGSPNSVQRNLEAAIDIDIHDTGITLVKEYEMRRINVSEVVAADSCVNNLALHSLFLLLSCHPGRFLHNFSNVVTLSADTDSNVCDCTRERECRWEELLAVHQNSHRISDSACSTLQLACRSLRRYGGKNGDEKGELRSSAQGGVNRVSYFESQYISVNVLHSFRYHCVSSLISMYPQFRPTFPFDVPQNVPTVRVVSPAP
eukprot:284816713_3